jgi:hypothetical protein
MKTQYQGRLRKLIRDLLYAQRKRWWTLEMVLMWARSEFPIELSEDDIRGALDEDVRQGYVSFRVDMDTKETRWQITADGINRVLED